jgi:hypothetical protein
MAVLVSLGITAGVLTWVVRPDHAAPRAAESASTPSAAATADAARSGGVTARTNRIAAVRTAPGKSTPVLGTIGGDESVEVVGRSAAATWLRIVFPPGSSLHGWVAADMLDITGDVNTLAVATAEPPVIALLPSASSRTQGTPVRSATVASAATTPTATALLPDLVVAKAQMGRTTLVVTIMNKGDGPANGAIVASVFTADGTRVLATTNAPSTSLAPHASVEVDTGYIVKGTVRLVVVVNPSGAIEESNSTNNSTTVAVVGG